MYSLDFEAPGILKVTVFGFFTPDIARHFAHDFSLAVSDARSRSDSLRMLMDASQGAVMTVEVAEQMKLLEERIVTEPSDRAAVVVRSSLHKLQIRRVFDASRTQVFLSENAARTWLLAYDVAPDALSTPTLGWPPVNEAPAAGVALHASH